MNFRTTACLLGLAVCAAVAALAGTAISRAQGVPEHMAPGAHPPPFQHSEAKPGEAPFEMVDPKVFRVCADPRDMPYSNTERDGFENKIAGLLAKDLHKSVAYTWYPNAPGFVRQTLAIYKCDIIMGVPQGDDMVQVTNPYYRSVYALVFKPDPKLDGLDSLTDPRLKSKRLGIVAGTPPATNLVLDRLMANAKSYPLVVDTRYDSSPAKMMHDIVAGNIDVGILWGPLAGYYAKQAGVPIKVVPLLKEKNGPHMAYRIGMGVRYSDQNWKRQLNRLIRKEQPVITALLLSYGVPLLDENNQLIKQAANVR
ncbi:MAG TPA: substrate-binding domain-containing protein [Pseudolabrys sp.]|nr:substrate-binding domain-containing protein [Pseudolabrys sp.]